MSENNEELFVVKTVPVPEAEEWQNLRNIPERPIAKAERLLSLRTMALAQADLAIDNAAVVLEGYLSRDGATGDGELAEVLEELLEQIVSRNARKTWK